MLRRTATFAALCVLTTVIGLALPWPAQGQPAQDATRVKAVIVGVADYAKLEPEQKLPRALEDARGLGRALVETLKVPAKNVVSLPNPTRDEIKQAWDKHVAELKPNDVSIFFFSGHGAEQNKEPFLLASNYDPQRALANGGIALLDMVKKLRASGSKNLAIFVVDACRREVGGSSGGKFIEGGEGFAPVRAADGTFIFYAASSNQVALHDLGQGDSNPFSVYTRVLLPLIEDPSRGLHDIAKDVRWETYQLALRRQTPAGVPKPHMQIPAYFDEVLQRQNILGTPLQAQARPRLAKGLAVGQLGGEKSLWACRNCPEMVEIPLPEDAVAVRSESGVPAVGSSGSVRLSQRYALGKYEVTRDEWGACQADGKCRVIDAAIIEGDRKPISGVTWEDAKAFTAWLNEKSGQKGFRLPSEAEWEHAARGGSASEYGPASDLRQLCDYANGADASLKSLLWANPTCDDGKARGVTSAGSYRPNLYGAHDMQGNVWEWVDTCYDAACTLRIAKGGSWRSGPDALKIGAFHAFEPDLGRATVGFRVARDLPE